MDGTEFIGLAAAFLTTLAYLPQVAKTWTTRSAEDFSLPTLLMLIVGIVLWTVYGLLRDQPSIWLCNGITLLLTASILGVKLRLAGILGRSPRRLEHREDCHEQSRAL